MARIKDVTGLRFGKLVTIKPTEKRNSNGSVYWLCKCDCGNEVVVPVNNLQNGYTKSCGCLHKETVRKHFGCMHCGSDKHYAKGYCKNCYEKMRRGTL